LTTIANIAQRILDENGYTVASFKNLTLTILEYKIDDAIDYVNANAGLTVAHCSGSAGTKSLVASDTQILVIKWLTNIMLRGYKDKGATAGVSSLNLVYTLADADTAVSKMIMQSIARLRAPPIVVANEPV
jgi:hypothetical protein